MFLLALVTLPETFALTSQGEKLNDALASKDYMYFDVLTSLTSMWMYTKKVDKK